MINPGPKDVGKRVNYLPEHDTTGRLHAFLVPVSGRGVIKSISKEYVFVCFEKGDDWTGAIACLHEHLDWDPVNDLYQCSPEALASQARDDLVRAGR